MRKYSPVVIALLIIGCSAEPTDQATMPIRPVSVTTLKKHDLARQYERTGVVNLYREEKISFEVDGRITSILNEGIEVRGPAYDEKGALVRRGDPVAAMEGSRYSNRVGALRAQLDATRRDLSALQAQLVLARQTLDRQRTILAEGAGAQQAVDDAQSGYDQAESRVAAGRAAVRAAEEQLAAAAEDLGDAILYAPFSGRITRVHVSEGAVVDAGTPIVTLTLLDPMRIQVEVSADDERMIETGDRAVVYPKDPLDASRRIPVNAIVFEKSASAHPELRTFRIDLIVRNLRRHVHDRDPTLVGLPNSNDYLPVVREYQGESGPLFIHTDTVYEDDGKQYVLRLPGVSFQGESAKGAVGKHYPERVRVELGSDYTTVANWTFRSISETDALQEGDFLLLNPRPRYVDGIAIGRPQWLLRPRELVPVHFERDSAPSGFYVPQR